MKKKSLNLIQYLCSLACSKDKGQEFNQNLYGEAVPGNKSLKIQNNKRFVNCKITRLSSTNGY